MEDIVIGKVLKPQGIKGEVKIMPITNDENRFYDLEEISCKGEVLKISTCKVRAGFVYLCFEDCNDRNNVEKYRGEFISIPREKATKLPEGSWFICDLIGCEVFDNLGTDLGTLTDVLQNGATDVYVINDGKLMFPALNAVLDSVDVINKKIVLNADKLTEVGVYAD